MAAQENQLTDEQVISRMDSLEYLRRPHLWTYLHRVPLKRSSDDGIAMVAIVSNDELKLVEGVNLFSGHYGDLVAMAGELLTAEQIVSRGWEVD